jgi:hypothetical protein
MRTLHGTIRAAHDHTGTFSISPHTTPHEAPEGATSFATLFLKITLYALSGFKMVNSFVPSTSPGSSSSTWYLTSNVAIILTTNWFATFLPMHCRLPCPNPRKHVFISAVASTHRSGRKECASGYTSALRPIVAAGTPTATPPGMKWLQMTAPPGGVSRGIAYPIGGCRRRHSISACSRRRMVFTCVYGSGFWVLRSCGNSVSS